jgi:hypothetical protein
LILSTLNKIWRIIIVMSNISSNKNLVKELWNKDLIYKILLVLFYPVTIGYLIWYEFKNPEPKSEQSDTKNILKGFWHRNIFNKIILIIFFPITLSYLFWIKANIPKRYKILILSLGWFLILTFSDSKESRITPETEKITQSNQEIIKEDVKKETNTQTEPAKSLPLNELILDKLKVYDKDAEISIWKGDDQVVSPSSGPFDQVIVNYPLVNNFTCEYAKITSYSIMANLYNDKEIRENISRVKVSIPYNLSVSLGSSDGIPLAENGLLNPNYGFTNFWKTMIESSVNQEKEFGKYNSRTWGVYLIKCNSELKKLFDQ